MLLIIETTDNIIVRLDFYSDKDCSKFLQGHSTTYIGNRTIRLCRYNINGLLSLEYSDHIFIVTKMKIIVIKLKKKNDY